MSEIATMNVKDQFSIDFWCTGFSIFCTAALHKAARDERLKESKGLEFAYVED